MTTWPIGSTWRALQPGRHIIGGEPHEIVVVDCGNLLLPSGRLVVADPFVFLERRNRYYPVPPGTYPVRATIDETIEREMYVSLLLSPAPEVERQLLVPYGPDDKQYETPEDGTFYGIPMDAGTVCLVDDAAVQRGMPEDEATWLGDLFDNNSETSWFNLMDNPAHIHAGLANIPLPLATDDANIIISHSGWGDGVYPVVGSYDAQGKLIAVHVDFEVHEDDQADTRGGDSHG